MAVTATLYASRLLNEPSTNLSESSSFPCILRWSVRVSLLIHSGCARACGYSSNHRTLTNGRTPAGPPGPGDEHRLAAHDKRPSKPVELNCGDSSL